nr:PREDICTED: E3 ubiquitin-protein ligase TRIM39-like [Latimeria chalumnae]|eukprot:XP_005998763.2 PREDICTED: E3 ubiquitin-protein ligase TRIM39-like [Latimeria chalumnae]
MASETSAENLEEELTCSVCHELFTDPVMTKCGHNFCRECVSLCWREKPSQVCPVCRENSAITDLTTNRTLRNIVDLYKSKRAAETKELCREHKERLKLFCLEDQELICFVCQTSKKHDNHKFRPINEAALDYKEEVKTALTSLQGTEKKLTQVKEECDTQLKLLLDKTDKTEKEIKGDFVKLHQFLHEEEKNLLADLKKEKEEKEQKMREKIKNISEEMTSLSINIKEIEKKLDQKDNVFLMNLRDMRGRIKEYADYKPRKPEAISAADIEGHKYTDHLQYRVWKKMVKFSNRETVTLDPNTAAPWLTLSEDLTAVTYGSTRRKDLPDNPERFDSYSCVLGSEGFTSGRHSWVVDVGNQTYCRLGVAAESADRKRDIDLKPEQGYWTVELYEGRYSAFTDEGETRLEVLTTPKKVLVCVDYEAGKVSFSDADDRSHIYTFTHKFKHRIFPFFWIWTAGAPLRICNL